MKTMMMGNGLGLLMASPNFPSGLAEHKECVPAETAQSMRRAARKLPGFECTNRLRHREVMGIFEE
jgi:hypothetical protein